MSHLCFLSQVTCFITELLTLSFGKNHWGHQGRNSYIDIIYNNLSLRACLSFFTLRQAPFSSELCNRASQKVLEPSYYPKSDLYYNGILVVSRSFQHLKKYGKPLKLLTHCHINKQKNVIEKCGKI